MCSGAAGGAAHRRRHGLARRPDSTHSTGTHSTHSTHGIAVTTSGMMSSDWLLTYDDERRGLKTSRRQFYRCIIRLYN